MQNIKISTKTNGYKAEKLQNMISRFNKAVKLLWKREAVTVEHFYYGDDVDMVTIHTEKGYANFNITQKRVALNGLSAVNDVEFNLFKELTYRDECYTGNIFALAGE